MYMCTSIALKTKNFLFGRNLDLHYPFGSCVVTPNGYAFPFEKSSTKTTPRYALIGTAQTLDGYPLYAEAANEKGLAIAGLNFPKNAYYAKRENKKKIGVPPYALIPFILRQCADIRQAATLLKTVEIINEPFRHDSALHLVLL